MSEAIQTTTDKIVVFTIDELSYALPLHSVIKVINAIEIRHLPKAPEIISGIINVKGRIIPVADIRKRFGLLTHEIELIDQLIIAHTGKREVAILVDNVIGIKDIEAGQLVVSDEVLPGTDNITGVVKTDDGLILICDIDRFLSLDEENDLEEVLKN